MTIKTCPSCGSNAIKRVRRNLLLGFPRTTLHRPEVGIHECPKCGEKVYDCEAMRRIEAPSPVFAKQTAA